MASFGPARCGFAVRNPCCRSKNVDSRADAPASIGSAFRADAQHFGALSSHFPRPPQHGPSAPKPRRLQKLIDAGRCPFNPPAKSIFRPPTDAANDHPTGHRATLGFTPRPCVLTIRPASRHRIVRHAPADFGYNPHNGGRFSSTNFTRRATGPHEQMLASRRTPHKVLLVIWRWQHPRGYDRIGRRIEFPNSQDYFSWFSLVGTCDGCKRMLSVADFECA